MVERFMSCIANDDLGPTPDSPLAGFSTSSLLASSTCPGKTVPHRVQTISPDSKSVTILSSILHVEHAIKFFILNLINYRNTPRYDLKFNVLLAFIDIQISFWVNFEIGLHLA